MVMRNFLLNHHFACDGIHDLLDLLGFSHHPRWDGTLIDISFLS
jgi:hypothetical protein